MHKLMGLVIACLCFGSSAFAGPFTITPTWGQSILNDTVANQNAIEGTIMSAIAIYEATFSDLMNVNITFEEGVLPNGGLGQSSTSITTVSYTNYVAKLTA